MSRWLAVRVVVDRVLAAVALAVASPLVAVCAWRVRRHDGGPPLIRVDRVGRDGRRFGMWKIRTMRPQGRDGTAAGASLTAGDDPRVTVVGRSLRRWHLDELPQLANVVAGDMALLGPRPEAPDFVDPDDESWAAVLAAPPGIAGPTQLVVGEWESDIISAAPDGEAYVRDVLPVKLALDRWYVERATPALDVAVVWALVRHLSGRADLGRLGRRLREELPDPLRLVRSAR